MIKRFGLLIPFSFLLLTLLEGPLMAEEITFPNGNKYSGELRDGRPHGKGKTIYPDGGIYVGEYKEGQYDGFGILTLPDGTVMEGDFVNGTPHGHMKMIFPTGVGYDGEVKDGKLNGRGKLTWQNGQFCEGDFVEGVLIQGFGRIPQSDGPHPYQCFHFPDGTLQFSEIEEWQVKPGELVKTTDQIDKFYKNEVAKYFKNTAEKPDAITLLFKNYDPLTPPQDVELKLVCSKDPSGMTISIKNGDFNSYDEATVSVSYKFDGLMGGYKTWVWDPANQEGTTNDTKVGIRFYKQLSEARELWIRLININNISISKDAVFDVSLAKIQIRQFGKYCRNMVSGFPLY